MNPSVRHETKMPSVLPSTWKLISAHEGYYMASGIWRTAKDKLH